MSSGEEMKAEGAVEGEPEEHPEPTPSGEETEPPAAGKPEDEQGGETAVDEEAPAEGEEAGEAEIPPGEAEEQPGGAPAEEDEQGGEQGDEQGEEQEGEQGEDHGDGDVGGAKEEAAVSPLEEHQPEAAPPPPPDVDTAAERIQVKFLVLPEGFSYVTSFPANIPAMYMYSQLERDLCSDKANFQIMWEGRPLQESDVLNEIAVIPDQPPLVLHLHFQVLPKHLALLNIGETTTGIKPVTVEFGEGLPSKVLTVTTVVAFEHKPFLGGFRHKKTAQVFHHAVAQTDPLEKEKKYSTDKVCRVTQTKGITRTVQTVRECATQMARPGLHIDTSGDTVVVAKPYFTSELLHSLRIEKSIVIQSYTRGWFARKHARQLKAEKEQLHYDMMKEDERRRAEHETKRQKEIERRTHPRTAKDFNTLYNELEAWRLQETRKIKESTMSQEEKSVALQELLKKETKLLQTIHKLQNAANKENKKKRVSKLLKNMAAHKTYGKTGTTVETPFTVRARELMDLFHGLQLTGLNIGERLDILLHIKWTVKEFGCPLTREIVELVDREADILNRGRPTKSLEGQRQRLSNLFLQFIETPEFNPEAIHHQPVPLEFALRPMVKLDNRR